ncbi:polyprenyl synthetase family protein [uncultured Mobiluncus sp.]|uniref:polyprenyl synthetase family protein n=1 Tax=uncultured Mobiluncus sp. TaxID=293425 RepID=UPI002627360B|nr:polyprenyl synthetase family protein [uncultured Mobiluncus sp.]
MLEEISLIAEVRSGVGARLAEPWKYCTSKALTTTQLDEFSAPTIGLLNRGKRFRAIAAYMGWISAAGPLKSDEIPDQLLDLGASLELFQASALVHDDIIDEAMKRRGLPSAQIAFMTSLLSGGPRFGEFAAILWGDLLYAAANSYFSKSISTLSNENSQRACDFYVSMQAEVAYGQFLDLSAETREISPNLPPRQEDAMEIIKHKTARYSVVIPLLLGAALRGASDSLIEQLEGFATPLGVAYQLRDDDLGIFGDQELTGKPAGDDIRSGKRTVQLALAWEMTDDQGRDYLMRYWGAPDLTPPIIDNICAIITGSGARRAISDLMNEHLEQSQRYLDAMPCDTEVKRQLAAFGSSLVNRAN